jgi:cell division protease FtsH
MKKYEMEAYLAMVFGGRVAEELIFGPDNVTTGAANDIKQATNMARSMVMDYGMSDKLGRIRLRENQEEVFLGHSVARSQNISEETARLIDAECRRLVDTGEAKAREVLSTRIDDLHAVAAALLEYGDLDQRRGQKVLNREPIERRWRRPTDPPPRRYR